MASSGMASFFARHDLGKFSKLLVKLGVESPEDLELIKFNDLTDEGMEQAAAENIFNRIQQIIQKENIASDGETEEDDEECASAVSVSDGHIKKRPVCDFIMIPLDFGFVNTFHAISHAPFDANDLDSHSPQRIVALAGTSYWSCMCACTYSFGRCYFHLFFAVFYFIAIISLR